MEKKDFLKRNIIITGANSGIGRACALSFSELGANIFLVDRNLEVNHLIKQEIKAKGVLVESFVADVSDEEDVRRIMMAIEKDYGYLDCAVNAAGIAIDNQHIHEMDYEQWKKVMQINAGGVWLCMKHEIPLLLKSNNAAIVNVSSIAGIVGSVYASTPYVASKHAVIGITRSAALQYASRIRVNAVCPGLIDTPMLSDQVKNTVKRLVPRRLGTPEEVANSILYLCSEKASYITGVALTIDGGLIT